VSQLQSLDLALLVNLAHLALNVGDELSFVCQVLLKSTSQIMFLGLSNLFEVEGDFVHVAGIDLGVLRDGLVDLH